MKKFLVFALMVILGLSSGYAQQGGGNRDPAARLQRQIDGLTTALSLTPDQVTKITPLVKEASDKMVAYMTKMRESGNVDREKMMAESKKSTEALDAKMKPLLKADQVTKLADYRKQQEQKMKERMSQQQ